MLMQQNKNSLTALLKTKCQMICLSSNSKQVTIANVLKEAGLVNSTTMRCVWSSRVLLRSKAKVEDNKWRGTWSGYCGYQVGKRKFARQLLSIITHINDWIKASTDAFLISYIKLTKNFYGIATLCTIELTVILEILWTIPTILLVWMEKNNLSRYWSIVLPFR